MAGGGNGTMTDNAIDAGLAFLTADQSATGEFESHASPLGDGAPVWVPDSLKFVTALTVLALDQLDDAAARPLVDRAVAYLVSERETRSQWRYWDSSNEQFDLTPPDADDTACCSMAVRTRGHRSTRNFAVLLANRDPRGRFYTWLIPRRSIRDPRAWWAGRDELRSSMRRRRTELWNTTEASPGDVDGVVNANVIRYLGQRAPREPVEWICSIIEQGKEATSDSWHRNPFTMYASVADAHRRGVDRFEALGPVIVERIRDRFDGRDDEPAPLDTAFALQAALQFGASSRLCDELAVSLRDRQLGNGSWERSVFYYGGPNELFGWASEALSTASALAALHRHARADL